MIRKLLATTAVATLVAAGAYAQEQPAPSDPLTTTQPAAPPASRLGPSGPMPIWRATSSVRVSIPEPTTLATLTTLSSTPKVR